MSGGRRTHGGQFFSPERHLHAGPLCPSVPLTPQVEDVYTEDAGPHLRGCQILLPSWGAANDTMRVRNVGRPLRRNVPLMPMMPRLVERHLLQPELLHSFSEPTLSPLSPSVSSMSPHARYAAAHRDGLRTPRNMRGILRKASKVAMHYPEMVPCLRLREPSPRESSMGSTMRSTLSSKKSVTWADEKTKAKPNTRNQSDMALFWRERSGKMLDAMFALRRAGAGAGGDSGDEVAASSASTPKASTPKVSTPKVAVIAPADSGGELPPDAAGVKPDAPADAEGVAADEAAAPAPPKSPKASPRVAEKDMPLMVTTLVSLEDTEAQLRVTEETLKMAMDPVCDFGGSRHATAIVSSRTLMVVKRKADLLKPVEDRLAKVQAHWENRELLAKTVIQGEDPPADMQRIKKFCMMYVHKDNLGIVGEPVDADKSNFESFCSTFGLPRLHMAIQGLLAHAKNMVKWWSLAALEQAQNGAKADVIHRLMEVVNNMGAEKGAMDEEVKNAMDEAARILGDRLAEKVLATALDLQAKDDMGASKATIPMPEIAREYANRVLAEIKHAVSLGAPTAHPALEQAKGIATFFELEEKNRYAKKAFQNAQKIQKQDEDYAMMCEKRDGYPPVGPGQENASKVEKEIKDAESKGVPDDHPLLSDTLQIAKALRDKDGERKRLANRYKRLKAEAEKKAAGG